MKRLHKVNFELVEPTYIECGYHKDDEGETECVHPDRECNLCCASNCPLGSLAEESDFRKAGRMRDYQEGAFVVIYKRKEE